MTSGVASDHCDQGGHARGDPVCEQHVSSLHHRAGHPGQALIQEAGQEEAEKLPSGVGVKYKIGVLQEIMRIKSYDLMFLNYYLKWNFKVLARASDLLFSKNVIRAVRFTFITAKRSVCICTRVSGPFQNVQTMTVHWSVRSGHYLQ